MLRRSAALCALLTLSGAPGYSWGFTGHHIIALIAEQRLSPETRARVDRLLLNGKYTLRDISACADQFRAGNEDPVCATVAPNVPLNTAGWHYINIPVPVKNKNRDLAQYCPNGGCIVDRIASLTTSLHDSTDEAERRIALLFLVHLMGDLHQPLHTVARACDQGGNRELVNFYLGKTERADERLHRVWDTDLIDKLMKDDDLADEQAAATALADAIDADRAQSWARTTVPKIAWESYAYAKGRVYRGIPFQDFCGQDVKPNPAVNLTAGYEATGVRTVREQLKKAGVRLAALLEANLTR